jgi:uncharacterized protein YdbL (DUF1318 family)
MSSEVEDEKTDKKLEMLKTLTDRMLGCRQESAALAARRRKVMFELNRNNNITYLELAAACDLNPARIAQEMSREISDRAKSSGTSVAGIVAKYKTSA